MARRLTPKELDEIAETYNWVSSLPPHKQKLYFDLKHEIFSQCRENPDQKMEILESWSMILETLMYGCAGKAKEAINSYLES